MADLAALRGGEAALASDLAIEVRIVFLVIEWIEYLHATLIVHVVTILERCLDARHARAMQVRLVNLPPKALIGCHAEPEVANLDDEELYEGQYEGQREEKEQ